MHCPIHILHSEEAHDSQYRPSAVVCSVQVLVTGHLGMFLFFITGVIIECVYQLYERYWKWKGTRTKHYSVSSLIHKPFCLRQNFQERILLSIVQAFVCLRRNYRWLKHVFKKRHWTYYDMHDMHNIFLLCILKPELKPSRTVGLLVIFRVLKFRHRRYCWALLAQVEVVEVYVCADRELLI